MPLSDLHRAALAGDTATLRRLLADATPDRVDALDRQGRTPLMLAAGSAQAGIDALALLVERGARLDAVSTGEYDQGRSALSFAIGEGDPRKVAWLLDAGADIGYSHDGYGALLDASFVRDILRDARLPELLRLLVARGARLDDVTQWHESALSVLSRKGRFDAIALLLEAGADPSPLAWTALHHAVANGTLEDVRALLASAADLEARDRWERTPWLLAVQTGDIDKARLLLDHGASREARSRSRQPALFRAIAGGHVPMLQWLIGLGLPIEATDQHGCTALREAAGEGEIGCVRVLLAAGADPDAGEGHLKPMYEASGAVAKLLLEAGADPQELAFEARRSLLGLPADPDESLFDATREDYIDGWRRRFGSSNPEPMDVPFWHAMVRSGLTGYQAARRFEEHVGCDREPVWCARRFGQSITFLDDGRIVQVAGEHEDSYDPDFCIYNDVFVHAPDGSVRIYGYPEDVFAPTDFHTATLVGEAIWLVGSLGYQGTRRFGTTPVAVLDTRTLRIERIETTGQAPGWIYQHRAALSPDGEIVVGGGTVARLEGGREVHEQNAERYALDVGRRAWRRIG